MCGGNFSTCQSKPPKPTTSGALSTGEKFSKMSNSSKTQWKRHSTPAAAAKRPHRGTRSHTNCSLSGEKAPAGKGTKVKTLFWQSQRLFVRRPLQPPGASGADPRRAFHWSSLNGSARGDFGVCSHTSHSFQSERLLLMPRFYGPCLLFDRPQKRAHCWLPSGKKSETADSHGSRTPLSGRNKPLIAALHLLISFYWLSGFPSRQSPDKRNGRANWRADSLVIFIGMTWEF